MTESTYRLVITEHMEDGNTRDIPHRAVRTIPACKALLTNYMSVIHYENATRRRMQMPTILKITSRIEVASWSTEIELPEQEIPS